MPEYNPETILQEQFESQRQQIQERFRLQWEDVNRQADDGLFGSQKEYEQTLHELHVQMQQANSEFDQKAEQAIGQLTQIDKLREMGAFQSDQQADETKWRIVLGPEAERAMFPPQGDPREEHRKILYEQERLMQIGDPFIRAADGILYERKQKKVGNTWEYTNEPDKNKPASDYEVQLIDAAAGSLSQLKQERLGLVQSMADQGIENPNRMEENFIGQQEKGWFSKLYLGRWGAETKARMRGATREDIMRGRETGGTFAQKVQETIYTKAGPKKGARNQPADMTKQPRVQRSRKELLAEYSKLGGSKTAEGKAFADRNLK